jgi:small-conductance mechanosensitive channel
MNSIQNWGDVFMTSAAGAISVFMAAIPKIIAFILILVIGWFLATLIGKLIATLLKAVKFNELAQRAGFSDFIRQMGLKTDASEFIANLGKWFIRLITLVVAFDALGLPAVSAVLQKLLLWLPNLVVAMVVLVIGGLAAKALSNVVRGATAKSGLGNPDVLAKIASIAVWAFSIIVAVNQLGVGVTLVNTLFMATVGAVALAVGLAFGLGSKETAGKIVAEWHSKAQGAGPKIMATAEAAQNEIQDKKVQL